MIESYFTEFEYLFNNFYEEIVCYAETGKTTPAIKQLLLNPIKEIFEMNSESDIQALYLAFQMLLADEKKIDVSINTLSKVSIDLITTLMTEMS